MEVTQQSSGICTKTYVCPSSIRLLRQLGYNKYNTNQCAELFEQIGEYIVVLQEFHSKYHIVSIVLLNPGSQVLQVFVLSDASTIE